MVCIHNLTLGVTWVGARANIYFVSFVCMYVCLGIMAKHLTKKAEIWHVVSKNPGEHYYTHVGIVMGVIFHRHTHRKLFYD